MTHREPLPAVLVRQLDLHRVGDLDRYCVIVNKVTGEAFSLDAGYRLLEVRTPLEAVIAAMLHHHEAHDFFPAWAEQIPGWAGEWDRSAYTAFWPYCRAAGDHNILRFAEKCRREEAARVE